MVETFNPSTLNLTEGAVKKIHSLSDPDKGKEINLRVYVTGGGCSGFQYVWGLSKETADEDINWSDPIDDVLLLDPIAEMYVIGSKIDYVEELGGSFLKIVNPTATTMCGCGESFGV